MIRRWPLVLLALDVVHVAGGGLLYLLRQRGMPYHEVVLGRPWGEVPVGTQTLVVGLMRVVGGSALAIATLAAVLLVGPGLRGERWAVVSVVAALGFLHLVQLWVIAGVAAGSDAQPPWQPAALGLITVVAAGWGHGRAPPRQ